MEKEGTPPKVPVLPDFDHIADSRPVTVDEETRSELNRRVELVKTGKMRSYTEAESNADIDGLLNRLELESKTAATAAATMPILPFVNCATVIAGLNIL